MVNSITVTVKIFCVGFCTVLQYSRGYCVVYTACKLYHVCIFSHYRLNHKKRDILFLTITLASLNRFL